MPRFISFQAATIVITVLLWAGAADADSARVRVAGPLQSQPTLKASATGTIKAGVLVDVAERKGFWAHVRNGTMTGWLKLNRLTLESDGSGNVIAALASGRTGSNNVVSASGGRGLDAAELDRATPDIASVSALSQSAASEAAADQFAKAGQLKTRHIDYMRAPKAAASTSRGQQ